MHKGRYIEKMRGWQQRGWSAADMHSGSLGAIEAVVDSPGSDAERLAKVRAILAALAEVSGR